MTTSLTRLTLQTLDNYRVAATRGVAAYRAGSQRLVGALDGALRDGVYARTERFAPRATERLNEARQAVTRLVESGIERFAADAAKAIEAASHNAAGQVERFAGFASAIEHPALANGLQAAARLTVPGARFGLRVSGKVVEGVNVLAEAAGGPARTTRAATAAAARKAGRRVATRATQVAKTAKAAKAGAKTEAGKLQRRTRAAGKRVARAATAA